MTKYICWGFDSTINQSVTFSAAMNKILHLLVQASSLIRIYRQSRVLLFKSALFHCWRSKEVYRADQRLHLYYSVLWKKVEHKAMKKKWDPSKIKNVELNTKMANPNNITRAYRYYSFSISCQENAVFFFKINLFFWISEDSRYKMRGVIIFLTTNISSLSTFWGVS